MADEDKRYSDVKERLIEAAGEIFARRGYRGATIRDICKKAGAHVGAVNYHFRDKKGLFADVLEHARQWSVRKYPPDAGLGPNASSEERLRAFIRSFLLRVLGQGVPDWHGQLIARETGEPSEALSQMVRSSIHPLYIYLSDIVRELLAAESDATDDANLTTFLCAMSVTSQCLQYFTSAHVIAALCPSSFDITDIDGLTDHITRFSLGGIRASADCRVQPCQHAEVP
jgi:TetR/AcrR family transcriptional regulator, regulator of cefoperazone and chloramphenicol sensitivity